MLGQQPIFPLCLIGNLFLGYPIVTHKTVLVIKPTGHWSNLIWKKIAVEHFKAQNSL